MCFPVLSRRDWGRGNFPAKKPFHVITVKKLARRREGCFIVPRRRSSKPRSPSHKALGEAIEELRDEANLTHEELADRLEVSFQRISELERGVANPTFATLIRITDGLDIELSELAARMERIRGSRRR